MKVITGTILDANGHNLWIVDYHAIDGAPLFQCAKCNASGLDLRSKCVAPNDMASAQYNLALSNKQSSHAKD